MQFSCGVLRSGLGLTKQKRPKRLLLCLTLYVRVIILMVNMLGGIEGIIFRKILKKLHINIGTLMKVVGVEIIQNVIVIESAVNSAAAMNLLIRFGQNVIFGRNAEQF